MKRSLLMLGMVIAIGCNPAPTPTTPVATGEYALTAEPANAKSVVDLRKDAKDGDTITIVGRIGGSKKPFVDGRAMFTIVDTSLKPCNEKDDDACKFPWDYCCDLDVLPQSIATIKIVSPDGKTISGDARTLLNVKELQTVVVQGIAKRDEAGNLTVQATGLYVRK